MGPEDNDQEELDAFDQFADDAAKDGENLVEAFLNWIFGDGDDGPSSN